MHKDSLQESLTYEESRRTANLHELKIDLNEEIDEKKLITHEVDTFSNKDITDDKYLKKKHNLSNPR